VIHGHKPNAYFVTASGDGKKIEGECRQCVHCQYSWEYHPGSGVERGYCLRCGGFLCARAECMAQQLRLIEILQRRYNQTRSCVPYEEWASRLREKVEKLLPLDPALTVTESGIIIPRSVLDGDHQGHLST
jgi:hypothetical protein